MVATLAEGQADRLLEEVRRLEPRHLMLLAALWAGMEDGALDPHRQRRRNAARIAARLAPGANARESTARLASAAEAVQAVISAGGPRAARHLRVPLGDASMAVADALEAIALGHGLTPVARKELLHPWRELVASISRQDGAK